MELTAVLIDDEVLTLKALEKIITSQLEHIRIIGQATDGEKGYELIKEKRPHLAVVDIRMPKVDGIQLMKQLKKDKVTTKIIVLSAFRDFNYVQQAMENGAMNYLLKPIDMSKFAEIMKEVEETIVTEYKQQEQILLKLLNTKQESYDEISIIHEESLYHIALIQIKNVEERWLEDRDTLVSIFLKDKNITYTLMDQEIIYILVKDYSEERFKRHINNLHRYLIQNNIIIRTVIGTNVRGNTLQGMGLELKKHISHGFYRENKQIIDLKEKSIFLEEVSPYINREKLFDWCIKGEEDKIIRWTMNQLKDMKTKRIKPLHVQIWAFELVINIRNIIMQIREEMQDTSEVRIMEQIQGAWTKEELNEFIKNQIRQLMDSNDQGEKKLINQIKAYCNKNYMQITLEQVADEFYLSKQYLSTFFKKQMDYNFWDYITELRIKRAKELLIMTNKKVNDIAMELGYTNASHFGKVFKQKTGQSPKSYRTLKRE